MSLNNQLAKEYSREMLAGVEAAFNEVWSRLHSRVPLRNAEATKELSIELSQTLAALVTDGVTDPKELRRRAIEALALMPR